MGMQPKIINVAWRTGVYEEEFLWLQALRNMVLLDDSKIGTLSAFDEVWSSLWNYQLMAGLGLRFISKQDSQILQYPKKLRKAIPLIEASSCCNESRLSSKIQKKFELSGNESIFHATKNLFVTKDVTSTCFSFDWIVFKSDGILYHQMQQVGRKLKFGHSESSQDHNVET